MDLSPAKWIWFPSERTLPNTFVLFRREIELASVPKSARGWVVADSRYRLTVNGERVQWGPAPSDPRHLEIDLIDLAPYLKAGKNVIGVEVLFFGFGDGTWPFGKPGLLLNIEIDGHKIVSDKSWQCMVDRAHRPGQQRRWFLRALQEEFDARLHPYGWNEPACKAGPEWRPAMELSTHPDRSAFSGGYYDYMNEVWMSHPEESTLSRRTIPLMEEEWLEAGPVEAGQITWQGDPRDWFDFRTPGVLGEWKKTGYSYGVGEGPSGSAHIYTLDACEEGVGRTFTFGWEKEIVGWPRLFVEAPVGTIVEVITHESMAPDQHWLDSHLFNWSRFICKERVTEIEPFDYEAFRFLQVHVHGTKDRVSLVNVFARRRKNAWPHEPQIQTGDPKFQKLLNAALQTLDNCAQDVCVDGMGRERQQYSGDASHQLHAVRSVYGSSDVPKRFLKTFGTGQTLDGVWFDSWPAYDRTARVWQREVGASDWGPLVDHSVGFCFDHYHHWMQTGDPTPAQVNWARIQKFVDYLRKLMTEDPKGLLPVEGLGIPAVWIDHLAFENPGQKRLAFNLYAGAMLRDALYPIAKALNTGEEAEGFADMGNALIATCQRHYWDPIRKLFVNSRYGSKDFSHARLDDRSLATAVLYDLFPGGEKDASVKALVNPPLAPSAKQTGTPQPPSSGANSVTMGLSYPANAVWRYWALAKAGHMQVVLDEFRTKWMQMYSVEHNGTIQEYWEAKPGGTDLMSHCAVSPLILLHQGILGLKPLKPGYPELEIRPQLCDLPSIETTAYIPQGAVHLKSRLEGSRHHATVLVPTGCEAHLVLPDVRRKLPNGQAYSFELPL